MLPNHGQFRLKTVVAVTSTNDSIMGRVRWSSRHHLELMNASILGPGQEGKKLAGSVTVPTATLAWIQVVDETHVQIEGSEV
ncbi:hypothetical protein VVR12_03280 [Rothia sp. LK2588]|uniref:hypothetical protein n=1 Tax=Rothia sp. LK2588 TaxID=3114369 RepID=UPI0034CFF27B